MTKAISRLTDNERKAIAYHEAGHLASFWFMGKKDEFNTVTITRRGGFVLTNKHVFSAARIRRSQKSLAKVLATRGIIHMLAGPYAENKATDQFEHWRVYLHLEDNSSKQSDIARATELDKAYDVANRRPSGLIKRAAQWTEECINDGHIWRVVEALANQLMKVDEMTNSQSWEIMQSAWGNGGTPPYMHMGYKWRNRVHLPS